MNTINDSLSWQKTIYLSEICLFAIILVYKIFNSQSTNITVVVFFIYYLYDAIYGKDAYNFLFSFPMLLFLCCNMFDKLNNELFSSHIWWMYSVFTLVSLIPHMIDIFYDEDFKSPYMVPICVIFFALLFATISKAYVLLKVYMAKEE